MMKAGPEKYMNNNEQHFKSEHNLVIITRDQVDQEKTYRTNRSSSLCHFISPFRHQDWARQRLPEVIEMVSFNVILLSPAILNMSEIVPLQLPLRSNRSLIHHALPSMLRSLKLAIQTRTKIILTCGSAMWTELRSG